MSPNLTNLDPSLTNLDLIHEAFDREALRRICEMRERDFISAFGLTKHKVKRTRSAFDRGKKKQSTPDEDFYAFKDNGSNVLAVAHLDTVVDHYRRTCGFLDTAAGPVVFSGALDDRLGAYIIFDLLPKLGINVDILVTTGEEMGRSTASFFQPSKQYNWIIEFDRGDTDVVMYQYEDRETVDLVAMTGARVGQGSFSDISYLEHLKVKAFNWGVAYQDYHSVRGHAYLDDTFMMLDYFMDFHAMAADEKLPHVEDRAYWRMWLAADEDKADEAAGKVDDRAKEFGFEDLDLDKIDEIIDAEIADGYVDRDAPEARFVSVDQCLIDVDDMDDLIDDQRRA